MKLWLASYPRSGNTFFRIILHEVYGVESSAFNTDHQRPFDKDYASYQVVKTHLLPQNLNPPDPEIPAVYIVRDGRDSIVSIAHQTKDIVTPGSDFESNMMEAILAARGSFFGGWSKNVTEWLKRASVVIRFEDLIENPIECVERIRPFMELPEPKVERLPTFEDLKQNDYQFNSQKMWSKKRRALKRDKFFRRGKVGSWKDEMSEELHLLFWQLHGKTMVELGYTDGMPPPAEIAKPIGTLKMCGWRFNHYIRQAGKAGRKLTKKRRTKGRVKKAVSR